MSKLQYIKQHLNNKNVVHLAMLAFAGASTQNVANFFLATHHHFLVAATIGLALGAGLMAVSVYLSNQDMGNRLGFSLLLAAAICMAVLSGQIQAMGYRLHGLDTFTAYLLGYAPPFTVEILLALSVSLAERNERERVRRDSKGHIKDSVATAMTAAFRDVDVTRIQRHIDRQVDNVVRAFVDDALGEMLAELNVTKRQPTHTDGNTKTEESRQIAAFGAESLPLANAERQRLQDERRHAITDLIAAYGALSTSELVQRLQDDRDIAASERTVRADCAALEEAGELVKSGRKWDRALSIADTLPVMTPVHTNGVAH